MKLSIRRSGSVLWILPVFLFILFTLISYNSGNFSINRQIWRGYYSLMIRQDAGFNGEDLLEKTGYGFVSLANETIDFFDYCGTLSVPLSKLDHYLETLDPRIDPFMKNLPEFFHARYNDSDWHIIYIATDESLEQFSRRLSVILPGREVTDWIIADERVTPNPWLPYLFLVFFIPAGILMGKSAWRLPLYIIPWLGIFHSGSLSLFIACGLIILTVFYLRSRILKLWKNHLDNPLSVTVFISGLLFPVLLFSCTAVFSNIWVLSMGFGRSSSVFILTGAGGLLSAMAMELLFEMMRVKRRDHRIFVPVFILKKPESTIWESDFLVPVVPALILAAAMILPFDGEEIIAPVPSPVFLADSGEEVKYDWNGLRRLERSGGGGIYPDLADYVSHTAYQEVFFYGGSYGFPVVGDKLEQEVVLIEEGEVRKETVVLKEFTDQWYRDILRPDDKTGIVALLLNQEAPCKIETAGTVLTNNGDWKKTGFALFSIYFSALLLFFIVKGRRKTSIEHKEPETLTYIREMEKENIA